MSNVDISNLSVAELEKLKGSIDSAIANRRDGELLSLREAIEDMVDRSGFTLEEVIEVMQARPAKKRIVKAKYSNPNNPEQTWSGRGRKPGWVEEWISTGHDLNDCLIPE
ncbi:H-NS histone family protein [Thiothrix subterranea]|uniref:H-NS histone family protein n=1 Tax=Thiothrix subterranea TaxID=2735563 RepID=A0AA51QVV8_9GAMM|nr:H-NS histone family protein [Thiothrix subterranea]MDQ5768133.1 H-NS histone family protein [Thiothrix subterranea]WML85313.1 H-NS histone family protein [Thiothrix subterranea]